MMALNDGLYQGYSKMDLVNAAFNEIGFSDYVYDLDPAQQNRVLLQLDGMMGTWAAQGINVGYPLYLNPSQSEINQESNLPATAVEACYLALACRISPSFGKTVSQDLLRNSRSAYAAMLSAIALDIPYIFPATLLAGAGSKNNTNGHFGNIFLNQGNSDAFVPDSIPGGGGIVSGGTSPDVPAPVIDTQPPTPPTNLTAVGGA
jgi:hypothetical protein